MSRKAWGVKIDFRTADKHKYFPQIYSITLGVHIQACPKYPKQQVYKIFAISRSKHKEFTEVNFCLLIIIKGFLKVILSF